AEPDIAGVSVPTPPGFSKNGKKFSPDGSPPVEDLGTPSQAVDSINLDWEGMTNGNGFEPSVTIPPGTWPDFSDPNYWPSILVLGDISINKPMSGRGLLVATGSVTMSGSATWDGIILAGEEYTSNGNNTVEGAVMTGLNVLLSDNPDSAATAMGKNSLGNGNKSYLYNSCYVKNATSALGGLVVFRNAWMDNWPAY
ncbi:MAG: hypothetical protein QNJ97_28645, partial [Myxococcota bacterium]|nr:hypothetical protein [Myxococcota bacterium]